MSTATVIMLPTAASAPVINPKRRGRLPGGIPTLSQRRRLKYIEEIAAEERRALQIHVGLLVRVCQRTSKNYGRVGRVASIGADRYLCVLTPVGGGFIDWNGASTDILCLKVADVEPQAQAALRAAMKSPSELSMRSRSRCTTEEVTS